MKRNFVAGAMLFAVYATTSSAQGSPLQIGVEGGAVIASIKGSDSDGIDSRKTAYAGVSLVVQKAGSAVGFQTGIVMVPKGAVLTGAGVEGTLAVNYVEVPLLLRLGLPSQKSRIVPALLVGASVGIKTSCKINVDAGAASLTSDCDDPAFLGGLDLKSFDFGVTGGAEVAIPMGVRFILAPNFRYTRGLTEIGDAFDNAGAKNSAFQVGAMLRIRL